MASVSKSEEGNIKRKVKHSRSIQKSDCGYIEVVTRRGIAGIRKADRIDFIPGTTIKIKDLNVYACRTYDRIEKSLYPIMLNLNGEGVDLGSAVFVNGIVDNVWLIQVWVAPHPCASD